jgi:hypothetical protein
MDQTTQSPWFRLAQRLAPRLRYPHVFLILLGLFLLDLVVPDPIPFVDEILLGLLTVLVGMLRRRETPAPEQPYVDVTPPQ